MSDMIEELAYKLDKDSDYKDTLTDLEILKRHPFFSAFTEF